MAESCVRLRMILWIKYCVGFSDVSGTSTTSKDAESCIDPGDPDNLDVTA